MLKTARMLYRYAPIGLHARLLVPLLIAGMLAVKPAQAAAPDYVTNEKPPPTSAADAPGLLKEGFEDKEQPPAPYDRRRKQIEAQFPLLRDSQVSISPRTYYFDRQRETGDDSVAGALGGSMVPLEIFPDTMVKIAHLTPHAWGNDAFATLIRHGGGVADITKELAVLTAYGMALVALASAVFRRSLTR